MSVASDLFNVAIQGSLGARARRLLGCRRQVQAGSVTGSVIVMRLTTLSHNGSGCSGSRDLDIGFIMF